MTPVTRWLYSENKNEKKEKETKKKEEGERHVDGDTMLHSTWRSDG